MVEGVGLQVLEEVLAEGRSEQTALSRPPGPAGLPGSCPGGRWSFSREPQTLRWQLASRLNCLTAISFGCEMVVELQGQHELARNRYQKYSGGWPAQQSLCGAN